MSVPYISKANNMILRGKIMSSIIDMNTNKITTVGTPTAGGDAVNKTYCDQNSLSGLPTITITLTGTTWNTIISNTTGVLDLLVANVVTGGPCAKFSVLKNESTRNASIQRWGSVSGTTTDERLEVRWLADSGLELRKNGANYDGQYKVRYFNV